MSTEATDPGAHDYADCDLAMPLENMSIPTSDRIYEAVGKTLA